MFCRDDAASFLGGTFGAVSEFCVHSIIELASLFARATYVKKSQGGDAEETAQGGGVALDDEDTLDLDDAGFSRTDLPAGGGVDRAEEDKVEEEKEVRQSRSPACCC